VLTLYQERINHFSSSYEKSALKNDPSERHPEAKEITGDQALQQAAGWCYQFKLLA